MVYATQSIHKLLAGISQASHVLVQDSQTVKLDKPSVQRSVFDAHVSTSRSTASLPAATWRLP
jgi:arginine decarboxylase